MPHPELTQVRQHVVVFSGRIIGVLSRIKLSDVTVQFVKKLEERVNVRKELGPRTDQALARAQALKLCAGGSIEQTASSRHTSASMTSLMVYCLDRDGGYWLDHCSCRVCSEGTATPGVWCMSRCTRSVLWTMPFATSPCV